MGKPSRASAMAGWNSSAQGSLPYLSWASFSAASAPGTPTESPLAMAASRGSGLPSRIEEELWRGGGGRGLAAVDACELLGARVPIENEAAAADARGLRLDQVEHHLRGDAGIDRAAAFAQDGEPGFRGERMGGDDHVPLRLDQRLRREAALAFRLLEGERARCQARSAAKPSESSRSRKENERPARHARQHSEFRTRLATGVSGNRGIWG